MEQENATDGASGRKEGAFLPQRVPWTVAEGFILFLSFLLIHTFFGALGVVVAPAEGRPAFTWGTSSGVVLLLFYIFLRVRCGSAAGAAGMVGLAPPKAAGPLLRALKPLLVGVMALVAAQIALHGIIEYFSLQPPEQPMVAKLKDLARQRNALQMAVLAFLAVIVVPVTEELTFRGLLYLPLRSRLGPVSAALLVSALFAAIHGYLAGLAHLFILALVLTELMEVTGSLFASMLGHAVHNGCMIVLIVAVGNHA